MRRKSATGTDSAENATAQRLDLWLWFARVVRTRRLAARLAESGHVRVNGVRVATAAKTVRIGDVLTIALDREPRVLRIVGFADRRGAFAQAQQTYEDLTAAAASARLEGDDASSNRRRTPGF